uniref:acetylcholinesterase n=1 Tax=Cupiennius salei TaxID=6928 RepID=A0AAU7E4B0_CUPSA
MHIFLFIAYLLRISSSELIIETTNGPIRSTLALSDDVEAFLGVPYAEPPTGDLRFAKPVPKKHWGEIYNASSLPPPCAQYSLGENYFLPDLTNMSEDCLYLNVWIPTSKPSSGLRPVIVYLHPGAFSAGSSNFRAHDGSHLSSRGDAVVVTINYRLGVFGYFLGYTEEANGNMGMYDQIMAIKWVKDNAKSFSGDPENVVLMGVSAGAMSVSGHMISPLSKNLFKKAIIQSGSIVHPLFLDDNPRLFKNSELVSSMVGCTNETLTLKDNPRLVVKCLKDKPKEDLIAAELVLLKSNFFNFFPRVNDEFLPKESVDLLREGKFRKDVDVLIGINKDEGALFLTLALPAYFGHYGINSVRVSRGTGTAIMRTAALLVTRSSSSELVNFYINKVENRTPDGYSKMIANILGDHIITCSTVFFADILSYKGNTVYFYKFGFRSPSTPVAEWMGTTHLDEVQYVFGNPYHANFTVEESELSHQLMDRWAAFAKKGNPNLPGKTPWLQYSYDHQQYLYFGQEEERILLKPSDRCEFWRKTFKSDFDSDTIQHIRNS